ncbi:oxidoreductase-like domain-containing protein [Uliginosibacterium sediminicola]|uniref:Oxidoreductase-like domain-containing protein n=1 Tax=Uliginosibacterium sediminicola TaxID=2024550 RepID=A0ABU9YT02_9RHOO
MSTPPARLAAPPQAPREPGPFDCCGNECGDACVWTIYYLARAQYEQALEAWQLQQLQDED